MRWKNISFIVKGLVVVLLIFIISEVVLRIFHKNGILSKNATHLLMQSSEHLFLTISNISLFLIVIFLPVFCASYFTRNIPKSPYIIKNKGKNQIIAIRKIEQYRKEGKGLLLGSLIALLYNAVDYFIIKLTILTQCSLICSFENSISLLFIIFYMITGIILLSNKENKIAPS